MRVINWGNLSERFEKVFICPYCDNQDQKGTEISWDMINTDIWSDGKCYPPLSINCKEVTRCSKCMKSYWIKDIIEFEEAGKNTFHEENDYFEAPSIGLLVYSINHLSAEKLVKVKLLQEFNDYIRENNEGLITPDIKRKHETNLIDLSRILDVNNITERVLLIEVLRAKGQFNDSQRLLENITTPYLQYVKKMFLKEINNANRNPFKLHNSVPSLPQ